MTAAATREAVLASACTFWQTDQVGGSSLIRGAARVLTKIPFYLQAEFITDHENKACRSSTATTYGRALLAELAISPRRDRATCMEHFGLETPTFAGRGIKPNPGNDEQILQRLDEGMITMTLRGVSLDPGIATSYGHRVTSESSS